MFEIITVVGARPQFIKAAALNRQFRQHFAGRVRERLLHTGQHYDAGMSDVFFQELEIDAPAFRLEAGSGSHGRQTGLMLQGIEQILLEEKPHAVIVYGDTNSTLAGALAASKLLIPVIHVEAGLRSFNKAMPEEQNRILTDHVSSLLFAPSQTGIDNLAREGFDLAEAPRYHADRPGVFLCGDVMYDNALYYGRAANRQALLLGLGLDPAAPFLLATVHRNTNTDEPEALAGILRAFIALADEQLLVWPVHPRTRKMIEAHPDASLRGKLLGHPNIKLLAPAGYLEMCALLAASSLVLTDSGGVQKEAYFFQKPCVVLRNETEWVELLQAGTCRLAGQSEIAIVEDARFLLNQSALTFPPLYGQGDAAATICQTIVNFLTDSV